MRITYVIETDDPKDANSQVLIDMSSGMFCTLNALNRWLISRAESGCNSETRRALDVMRELMAENRVDLKRVKEWE